MYMTYGFGGMGFFPIIVIAIFAVIIIMFILTVVKVVKEWAHNSHSPLLIVDARVVDKRTTSTTHGMHMNANGTTTPTSTFHTYYVTFEVESGDRLELSVPGEEYGYLVKDDEGKLSFKGTKFIKFDRM